MKSNKRKESYPYNIKLEGHKTFLDNYKNDLFKEDSLQLSGRFASDFLIKHSSELLKDRVLLQSQNYSNWFRQDSKLIGLIVNKDFTTKFENSHIVKIPEIFQIKKIKLNQENNSIGFEIDESEEWSAFNEKIDKSSKGVHLFNQIMKMNRKINLKCLGVRVFLQFSLEGPSSNLSVLLRSNQKISNEEVILVQFVKDGNEYNSRLFVLIGKLNENKREFVYLKKCEVPLIEQKENFVLEDKLEIKTTIVDFGNDKIQLHIEVEGKSNKPLKLKYSELCIPFFDDFFFYVVGNGDNTFVKKLILEFFDRKEWESDSTGDFTFGKCHCKIF